MKKIITACLACICLWGCGSNEEIVEQALIHYYVELSDIEYDEGSATARLTMADSVVIDYRVNSGEMHHSSQSSISSTAIFDIQVAKGDLVVLKVRIYSDGDLVAFRSDSFYGGERSVLPAMPHLGDMPELDYSTQPVGDSFSTVAAGDTLNFGAYTAMGMTSCSWSSAASIKDAGACRPVFPDTGWFTLDVRFSDTTGFTLSERVKVYVPNYAPTVEAEPVLGSRLVVGEACKIVLNADAVYDANLRDSVVWTFDNGAPERKLAIRDTLSLAPPYLDCSRPDTVTATFVVQDRYGSSTSRSVMVTVRNGFQDARDGEYYATATYSYGGAEHTWMAENLNYSGDDGAGHKTSVKGWCYGVGDTDTTRHDDSTTCDNGYGRLYRWNDVMALPLECNIDTLGSASCPQTLATPHQGICPEGWHVPSDAEWTALTDFVEAKDAVDNNAGAWLKAVVTDDTYNTWWNDAGRNLKDPIGFSALPAGYRDINGRWQSRHFIAIFRSASEEYPVYAWIRSLDLNHDSVNRENGQYGVKNDGYSLRCLRDTP